MAWLGQENIRPLSDTTKNSDNASAMRLREASGDVISCVHSM